MADNDRIDKGVAWGTHIEGFIPFLVRVPEDKFDDLPDDPYKLIEVLFQNGAGEEAAKQLLAAYIRYLLSILENNKDITLEETFDLLGCLPIKCSTVPDIQKRLGPSFLVIELEEVVVPEIFEEEDEEAEEEQAEVEEEEDSNGMSDVLRNDLEALLKKLERGDKNDGEEIL